MNDHLHKTAENRSGRFKDVLQTVKYCDLHCDALTQTGVMQVTGGGLRAGGCFLQCFAAFISEREGRLNAALSLCDKFYATCKEQSFLPVRRSADLRGDVINALLTVEDGGACEGSLEKFRLLSERGVRMITLTWNYPNEIGYPNFPDYEGLFTGRCSLEKRETERGLTPFGRELAEHMGGEGVIVDVSHGSDRLFYDVAEISKRNGKAFVASHSGAESVYRCARNLTDGQIRTLADCGGVVGLNFCADFLSDDKSAEGQRAALLAHAQAIVDLGGEDVLAIGSDFDGIPQNPYLKTPADVPLFLHALESRFGARVAEKIAYGNFLRVFRNVCG